MRKRTGEVGGTTICEGKLRGKAVEWRTVGTVRFGGEELSGSASKKAAVGG